MVSRNDTSADGTTFIASYYGGYIIAVKHFVRSLSGQNWALKGLKLIFNQLTRNQNQEKSQNHGPDHEIFFENSDQIGLFRPTVHLSYAT